MNIVKRNSSSPFLLQRSIVDQGGNGGAYEEGGFNPNVVYSDTGIAAGISALGKIVGAGLSSVTEGDINDANIARKKRIDERSVKVKERASNTEDEGKKTRLENRAKRLDTRSTGLGDKIKKYNELTKPTLKSDINKVK